VLEANGAGCALFDLGGDGDLDAAFAQGLESLAALAAGHGAALELFENQGGGRFRRVTGLPAGPRTRAWWTGLAAGDVDGDGMSDLVSTGFGRLACWLQGPSDGNGGLRAPRELAPQSAEGSALWNTSAALFDADLDGHLDLFVGRYVAFDPASPPIGELFDNGETGSGLGLPCLWKGREVFCGPRGMAAQPDAVYRGTGEGTFEDRTREWLHEQGAAYTLGVAALDADLDGQTDLYVANDSEPNRLYVNRIVERGRFEEHGYAAGVAVNPDGAPEAGMGIAVGDLNGDGRFDLAVTNFSDEPTQLYIGASIGYRCATYRSHLASLSRPHLAWGVHLVDFTGNGSLELFTANGHVYPQADGEGSNTSYAQVDALFAFDDEGRANALVPAGTIFTSPSGSRSSAVGDVDGDGAPDLLITRIDGAAALGINRLNPEARRVELRLRGSGKEGPGARRTPADAMGARIELVRTPPLTPLVAQVQTSGAFQSASSPFVHFGLGVDERFEKIMIFWPSGLEEEIPGGASRRRLWIREGEGIVREEELP